jgi:uncharacterized protein
MKPISPKSRFSGDLLLNLFAQEMRRRLGRNLRQMILFGSRARGDHSKDSDYDCLAVLEKISPHVKDLIDEVAGQMLYEHNAVFFVLPMKKSKKRKKTCNPLLLNIEKEGIYL